MMSSFAGTSLHCLTLISPEGGSISDAMHWGPLIQFLCYQTEIFKYTCVCGILCIHCCNQANSCLNWLKARTGHWIKALLKYIGLPLTFQAQWFICLAHVWSDSENVFSSMSVNFRLKVWGLELRERRSVAACGEAKSERCWWEEDYCSRKTAKSAVINMQICKWGGN